MCVELQMGGHHDQLSICVGFFLFFFFFRCSSVLANGLYCDIAPFCQNCQD